MALVTSTVLAIASLVVAAGSAYAAHRQAQSAARARKKANEVSSAQAQVKQQQDIRDQVRAKRIKRAQIMQAAADTGTQFSSGELGSVGALETQTATNIGDISGQAYSNRAISRLNQQAADATSRQQTFAQVSGLATQGFSLFSSQPGAQKDFAKIFG